MDAAPSARRASPSAKLAAPATDNGLLAPELAAGHRARDEPEVESACAQAFGSSARRGRVVPAARVVTLRRKKAEG
jgi:hypothetical protein